MLAAIQRRAHFPPHVAMTINDVASLANRAVHGQYIKSKDAEAVAQIGARLLEELQTIFADRVSEPLETKKISHDEMDRWATALYKVTTIIPRVDESEMNIRHLDQNGLDELLDGYSEYAE